VYCAVNNYDHNSGRPLPIYVSTAWILRSLGTTVLIYII
jgi:hypothetical protein